MSSINPFIAATDGVIAGYSDLQSSGLIDHFFCHHNYQGCGVGKALMSQIFSKVRIAQFIVFTHKSVLQQNHFISILVFGL
jgi:GNAT superfamily N-acetyltransferase